MGWAPGIVALLMGIAVTYYASILLASLHEFNGVRYVRYRDLATAICGNPWAGYAVVTFQQVGLSIMWNLRCPSSAALHRNRVHLTVPWVTCYL